MSIFRTTLFAYGLAAAALGCRGDREVGTHTTNSGQGAGANSATGVQGRATGTQTRSGGATIRHRETGAGAADEGAEIDDDADTSSIPTPGGTNGTSHTGATSDAGVSGVHEAASSRGTTTNTGTKAR